MSIRPPAAAGTFYPADPVALRKEVRGHLRKAASRRAGERGGTTGSRAAPAALVAPHAGYVFSGPVAGTAYETLVGFPGPVRRVVVLGPAHHVEVEGLVVPTADGFATPLGDVPVDREGVERALSVREVSRHDAAHVPEHSIETQLPFLQEVLGDFALVPILVGFTSGPAVAATLDAVWEEGPGTLVVVSSDLSHYLSYYEARKRDEHTAEAIESLAADRVGPEDACGFMPLRGLIIEARKRRLLARTLDLRSSGDTAGTRDRVVGYGAFVLGAPRA